MNKKLIARLLALFIGLFPFVLNAQNNCEEISIQTIDNELIVSGLAIGKIKARIYNNAYELVEACEFDCDPTITIPNVVAGETYHFTFEFFTDNFGYIYQDNRDYAIGSSALTIGLCKETLKFYTQSEVDDFCGCEIALNGMEIGNRFVPQLSDVSDISNLSGIKGVGDALIVWNAQMTSLSALNNLFVSRNIFINNNPLLQEIGAFQDIESLDGVSIVGNTNLAQVNGFQSLSTLSNVLAINSNPNLTELNGFNELTSTNIFQFENNDNFQSLTDFAKLETVGNNFNITGNAILTNIEIPNLSGDIGNVFIGNNPQLQNLPSIGSFNVTNLLQIQNNPKLTDCCELYTSFDEDLTNGHSGGELLLNDNGNLCNSVSEILANCDANPCDTSICQGDVTLETQADVDAFCGCERIEGNLTIGEVGRDGSTTDITSIKSLRKLREIGGNFSLYHTLLRGLDDLGNLKKVEKTIGIDNNSQLENTDGLANLVHVEKAISILNNAVLDNLDGFDGLREFNSHLVIQRNPLLQRIGGFSNVKKPSFVSIAFNNSLKTLEGLEGIEEIIKPVIENRIGALVIWANPILEDISSVGGIKYIEGDLTINQNPLLNTCCAVSDLLDNNAALVSGLITINDNLPSCNSIQQILQNCESTTTTCEDIQINTDNNRIILSNLAESPNEIIKIFDKDYNIVYECVSNCVEKQQLVSAFPDGTYIVDIQLYDENWVNICAEQRTIILESTDPCTTNPCETTSPVLANIPADATVECDDIPAEPTNITATDNCDTNVELNFEEIRTNGNCPPYTYLLTRIWTATDDCGNTAQGVQVISVEDSTPPILANVPADVTYSSLSEIPAISSLSVTATDNCDTDVFIEPFERKLLDTPLDIFTRTFTATDNCGNTASALQTITISDEIEVNSCEDISLESFDNQLIIKIFSAPNTLVKVFDNNWQLVFQCGNDCDQTLIFEDLQIGDVYRLDAQFYDENWQLICSKKADKQIGSDTAPCPDPICQGNITLKTQAEVDAFCGCEKIDGQLTLGENNSMGFSDINDLSNLSGLKEVGGSLVFLNTSLTNLSGLNALEKVGSLLIFGGRNLISISDLERLTTIGFSVNLVDCPLLTNIDVLKQITFLNRISINNVGIEDLSAFSNLQNKFLNGLSVVKCSRLTSLKGMEGIQIFDGAFQSFVSISDNPYLTDISALKNVELIDGQFSVLRNFRLRDCCSIEHLVDQDPDNGQVTIKITIERNLFECSSVSNIINNCQDVPPVANCDNVQIDRQGDQMIISEIKAPNSIVKVFNKDYQIIFECAGDCEEIMNINNLNTDEVYHVDIQFYDRDWVSVCNLVETVNSSAESRTNDLQSIDFSIAPNPAQAEVSVDLKRLVGERVTLQIHNQFGQVILTKEIEKATRIPERINLSEISNGLYILQIQTKGRRAIGKKILVNRLY